MTMDRRGDVIFNSLYLPVWYQVLKNYVGIEQNIFLTGTYCQRKLLIIKFDDFLLERFNGRQ